MAQLYIDTAGSGPDLVLVHGWGLHGGVWDTLLPALVTHFRVTRVDLPGHGASRDRPPSTQLTTLARQVLDAAPFAAHWLGWSLGGMVAMQAALLSPARVRRLVLVATTPRFLTAPDWPHAMAPETLARFAAELERDYRTTVLNFLALQVQGDETARATLRALRASVFARGEPDPRGLHAGLEILQTTDLRGELARLRAPALVVAGERDRLTPPAAGRALAQGIPGARFTVLKGAAHAPFLSHADDFVRAVAGFFEA
ncbi:MAG TPA: pimeloyl-ACP methyl ester esterase BioH [Gammaproteobacteria bacterium]|nr:pimeloyl-ACP methyl ester esterase BioH [Gammaproteobacteria bacterium]